MFSENQQGVIGKLFLGVSLIDPILERRRPWEQMELDDSGSDDV